MRKVLLAAGSVAVILLATSVAVANPADESPGISIVRDLGSYPLPPTNATQTIPIPRVCVEVGQVCMAGEQGGTVTVSVTGGGGTLNLGTIDICIRHAVRCSNDQWVKWLNGPEVIGFTTPTPSVTHTDLCVTVAGQNVQCV